MIVNIGTSAIIRALIRPVNYTFAARRAMLNGDAENADVGSEFRSVFGHIDVWRVGQEVLLHTVSSLFAAARIHSCRAKPRTSVSRAIWRANMLP